jgi:hypothetical protein
MAVILDFLASAFPSAILLKPPYNHIGNIVALFPKSLFLEGNISGACSTMGDKKK